MRKELILTIYIIIILIMNSCSINTNNNKIKKKEFTPEFTTSSNIPSSFYEKKRLLIQAYATTLNQYKKGDNLPEFLFNVDFDYENVFYLKINKGNSTKIVSLRKLIFDHVENQILLLELFQNPNKIFDTLSKYNEKESPFLKIEYGHYSNRELAKMRYETITKRKN